MAKYTKATNENGVFNIFNVHESTQSQIQYPGEDTTEKAIVPWQKRQRFKVFILSLHSLLTVVRCPQG